MGGFDAFVEQGPYDMQIERLTEAGGLCHLNELGKRRSNLLALPRHLVIVGDHR
jgi:hypothetical protein